MQTTSGRSSRNECLFQFFVDYNLGSLHMASSWSLLLMPLTRFALHVESYRIAVERVGGGRRVRPSAAQEG